MRKVTPARARTFSVPIAFGGLLAVLVLARPAAAEEIFPGVIQDNYGGTCAPQCTLCHNRPEGGPDHYKSPSPLEDGWVPKNLPNNRGEGQFFSNMIVVNGGLPTNESALKGALHKLATLPCTLPAMQAGSTIGPCDSDGDGIPDMKEFAVDGDPDVADAKNGQLCQGPKYGCGATIAPLPHESTATWRAAAVLAALGVGLVFARRWRR
jgi:hypothetical protein